MYTPTFTQPLYCTCIAVLRQGHRQVALAGASGGLRRELARLAVLHRHEVGLLVLADARERRNEARVEPLLHGIGGEGALRLACIVLGAKQEHGHCDTTAVRTT